MVSERTIRDLINQKGETLVTITLPTHEKGEESKQDPIRFKNLISEAEKKLEERVKKNGFAEKFLKPAKELLDTPMFWSHQKNGLAVYITEDSFNYYKLPYEVNEQVLVNDHFLITPLLPMTSMDGTFSVLAASRKNVRLLRCSRNSVHDITPQDIETSVSDYLEVDPQKQLQFHSGAKGQSAVYHGHNANEEDKMVVVEAFYREIEKELTEVLNKANDPLIIVGLVENANLYEKVNSYNRLVDEKVNHNPDELSDKELRDKGWEVVRHYFLSEMYQSLNKFSEYGEDRVSNNLGEIIESTVMGKSSTIFISRGETKWGKYDEENHTVHYSTNPNGEDVELLNWLSITGFKTGSKVYVLPKEEMPIRSTVAAEFRF
ncbi:baeRF7 domain-containing protein [Rhodohalobacter sp. 614A]|uniref:baeRF7 domain-containing protein n=1 Tax=Rhodohalobacter sp. 614A TaxID=2908649 RepID=UPI001F346934|nr:hypothetical protein [Rhodohalobacter sp. 614A]